MKEDRPAEVDALVQRTLARFGGAATDMKATVGRPSFAPAADAKADRIGLTLGESLGKGGMGSVRLATQDSLGRAVAVKSLLDPSRTEDIALLLRESRVLGRLEHPNVVPVHGLAWDERDGPLLVMKRIEGVAWGSQLGPEGGRDRLEHHLGILATVCQALHFAHARGVLHCDLKPSNVMVGAYGEVYLVDWGVARLLDDAPEVDPPLLGTPAYMAPEMVLGHAVDARTDVFLLGATLHEVLTGRPRHAGHQLAEVLRLAVMSRPATYGPDVPAALGELCNRACAPDPSRRPADALAFREAILDYLRHRASIAVADEASRRLAAADRGGPSAPHHLAAARFGFEQAVREWPGNTEAATSLQACLRRLVEHDLSTGNVRGAELLLAELTPPDPKLGARLEKLRTHLAQGVKLAGILEAIRHDRRLEGATWGRSLVTLVTSTISGLFILFGGSLAQRGDPGPGGIAAFLGVGLVITLVGLYVLRRQLLDNALYRRLMTAFACTIPLLAAAAYLGHRAGASFHQLVVGAIVMMAAFALLLANVVSRVFWVAFAVALGVAWAATGLPDQALDLAAAGWMAHGVWIAWVLRPPKAEATPSEPPVAG